MRLLLWLTIVTAIRAKVLDPSIYLSPSPPLRSTKDDDVEKLWSRSIDSIVSKKGSSSSPPISREEDTMPSQDIETMESSETFWPSFRSNIRGIHVPLSFHLSGTYGGNSGAGVYTSSYMGMADGYGNKGKAVLAGTNYKSYGGYSGLRVYGGETKPAWSGWGNGRWGHYGKG